MKPRKLAAAEKEAMTIAVTALGQRGEGLAIDGKRRIYIPGALPGETVLIQLEEQVDRDVYRAKLQSILEMGAQRDAPPCMHFGICGGCALQHLQQETYRAWKTAQIKTIFEKTGLYPEVWLEPLFIPQATRRRASFSIRNLNGTLSIGFQSARSNELVPINECLLLNKRLMQVLDGSKQHLRTLVPERRPVDLFLQDVDGQTEALLTGDISDHASSRIIQWATDLDLCRVSRRFKERDQAEVLLQRKPVLAHFRALTVSLPPGAFLQPSREGQEALTETVKNFLLESETKSGSVADLFAGCGTFTGILLENHPVHAVEIDEDSIQALKAAKAGSKLTLEKRNLFTMPLMEKELARHATVLLDPPRAGAEAQVERLAKSKVPALIYVSCNPASFARDAKILIAGGYRLKRARLIDQFIWSIHSELVTLFVK